LISQHNKIIKVLREIMISELPAESSTRWLLVVLNLSVGGSANSSLSVVNLRILKYPALYENCSLQQLIGSWYKIQAFALQIAAAT
jgi:hypothetical protein